MRQEAGKIIKNYKKQSQNESDQIQWKKHGRSSKSKKEKREELKIKNELAQLRAQMCDEKNTYAPCCSGGALAREDEISRVGRCWTIPSSVELLSMRREFLFLLDLDACMPFFGSGMIRHCQE
jgi:hypothetical protein